MRQTLPLLCLFSCLFVFWSCSDQLEDLGNIENTQYNAAYALPVINSKIKMNDILEDFEDNATLTVAPDGLLRFQYSGDILTKNSDDVFESINETINGFGLIPLVESRQALPFALPNGLSLDRLQNKGTKLKYALANRQNVPVTITLVLPTVTLDGVPFTVTGDLPAWSGEGVPPALLNLDNPTDMTGYDLTLENDSIYIEVTTVDADGNTYEPGAGSVLQFEDFAFSYAEGYLGNVDYEGGRDTIEIDFFDNWIQGDVYFEDPVVTFNFENSFGVPTEAVVNIFNIITAEGETLPLESTFIEEGGISFPYPAIDEVGEVKNAAFVFDKNNSNIDVVLGSKPVAIDYDVNALTNPDNDATIRGFITDSSYYKVLVDVELPLYGQAANFVALDTFELNLGSYDDIDEIEWKLVTTNGLPLGVSIQGTFLDEAGNELGNLFAEESAAIVAGAAVDGEGRPTQANEVTTFINWDNNEVNTIINAKKLALRAVFSTTLELEQSVRIQSDQELEVKLGAIIKRSNK